MEPVYCLSKSFTVEISRRERQHIASQMALQGGPWDERLPTMRIKKRRADSRANGYGLRLALAHTMSRDECAAGSRSRVPLRRNPAIGSVFVNFNPIHRPIYILVDCFLQVIGLFSDTLVLFKQPF
jgi:hypothetical protein